MTTLTEAASKIEHFEKGGLTKQIAEIESRLHNMDRTACEAALPALMVLPELLDAALVLKNATGQINVLIHAIGILLSLPHILSPEETIEYLSLGAGNTGRAFDLETNFRIAEFKFIHWRGSPEAIRQNSLFKDFYYLAEDKTRKKKYLYVLGVGHPMKFLQGNRALSSVMSRNIKLMTNFRERYGNRFTKVCEYYKYRKHAVQLVDLALILPQVVKISSIGFEEQTEGM